MPPVSTNKKSNIPASVDCAKKVFEEHGDFIRAVIRFNVRNETLSEDLFQDLFLSLILKPIPGEVRNVKGFLYKLICDNIKDAYRRIDRYQRRMNRYAERCVHRMERQPENILIEMEEVKKMFGLIGKYLSQREALAIKLRYRDDHDTTKIAEMMGIKPGSVNRYVCIGLKKVRQVFHVSRGRSYDHF